jgi:hypothetical protein
MRFLPDSQIAIVTHFTLQARRSIVSFFLATGNWQPDSFYNNIRHNWADGKTKVRLASQSTFLRRVVLPLGVGTLFLSSLALLPAAIAPASPSVTSSLAAFTPYDPATYGIPYIIAGYKILAVKTAQNTACIPRGRMTITIQSPEPDVQSFLDNSGNMRMVSDTLKQMPSLAGIDVMLMFTGPHAWNPARFMAEVNRWNDLMKKGCNRLGGAIPSMTPRFTAIPTSPTPPAPTSSE